MTKAEQLARAHLRKHGDAPCCGTTGEPREVCLRDLTAVIETAMKEQRQACADAVNELPASGGDTYGQVSKCLAYQAAMKAEVDQ